MPSRNLLPVRLDLCATKSPAERGGLSVCPFHHPDDFGMARTYFSTLQVFERHWLRCLQVRDRRGTGPCGGPRPRRSDRRSFADGAGYGKEFSPSTSKQTKCLIGFLDACCPRAGVGTSALVCITMRMTGNFTQLTRSVVHDRIELLGAESCALPSESEAYPKRVQAAVFASSRAPSFLSRRSSLDLACFADVQIDPRYVGKPNRYVYTNALLGDAGFLNGLQRGDLQGDNEAAWTTHVSECNKSGVEHLFFWSWLS